MILIGPADTLADALTPRRYRVRCDRKGTQPLLLEGDLLEVLVAGSAHFDCELDELGVTEEPETLESLR